MTTPEETRLLQRVSTPSNLARYLTEERQLFGYGIKFSMDPWISLLEQRALEKFLSPKQEFLGANAPSQIGKSTYCGLFLPFWILGHFPETRIIHVCYSESLAVRDGSAVRELVMDYGPELFGIDVDPDYSAKGDWKLKGHRGGMLSVGLGGSITGRSGDFVHLDDLLKNIQEAGSSAVKDQGWEEYQGTLRSRLQPGGLILISATRFAEDDLTGRLKEEQKEKSYAGDDWEWLSFKAIAAPDRDDPKADDPDWRDMLGRKLGEPLKTRYWEPGDDENWDDSFFYRLRRALKTNPTAWNAIYQQEPINPEGGMFPQGKWKFYDPDNAPQFGTLRRTWDLAATKDGGDWSVGTKVGKTANGDFYVLDMQRFQLDADAVKEKVKTMLAIDGMAVPILIEQERSGAGKTVVSFYQQELMPATVRPAKADGSKTDRARPYSTLQQSGKVYLPQDADWLPLFMDEHAAMTGDGRTGRHDDIIDTVAHAINDMLDGAPTEVIDPMLHATDVESQLSALAGGYFSR